jgi:hypothetical protein
VTIDHVLHIRKSCPRQIDLDSGPIAVLWYYLMLAEVKDEIARGLDARSRGVVVVVFDPGVDIASGHFRELLVVYGKRHEGSTIGT